jgi:hypothetical protein
MLDVFWTSGICAQRFTGRCRAVRARRAAVYRYEAVKNMKLTPLHTVNNQLMRTSN